MSQLAGPEERSGTWVYVYAVVTRPMASELRGIDGEPVRWITEKALAAAVSDVPAAEFDEEPLNENVRDMSWLGPRALAHQEVNARLFEQAEAIVPLAFGTVFRADSGVERFLREQRTTLAERLARVRGAAEWVVMLHLLREPDANTEAVQTLKGEIESSSPGKAHLLRRQLATLERDEARRLASEAAEKVLDALRGVARDVYREPLPTDAVERPLLRASVLVPHDNEADFMDVLDDLRRAWPEPTYRLLLTGPWPPYRFGGVGEH